MMRRANLTLSKAMNILGASKTTETNIMGLALNNPISLTFFKGGATYTQTNVWPFRIGTTVSMTGQYSQDTLPTSEQIAFGAQRYANGYQPGKVSGDSGWSASFEVNRPLAIGWTYLQSVMPYASIDAARVFYLRGGTPQPRKLSSVGVAFACRMRSITASIYRSRAPIGDAPIESASRSPRVNASLSYQLN